MDLSSMIENSVNIEQTDLQMPMFETTKDTSNVQEQNVKTKESPIINDINCGTDETTNQTQPDIDSLNVDVIDLKKYISDNADKLQYTKYIDISSDDITNEDGIVILKSIEENKNIIQLYKDMNNYNVFNNEIEYMKLFGENGFMIKYAAIGEYHFKLYGTKSSMCATLFISINDKQYPIYYEKFSKTKFDKLEWPDDFHLMSVEEYTNQLNDDRSFDIEDCCIYYNPLYKKMDELTTKKLVIDKLHEILTKTYDVSHCIKIINAIINII